MPKRNTAVTVIVEREIDMSESIELEETKVLRQKIEDATIGYAAFPICTRQLDHAYGFSRPLKREGVERLCASFVSGLKRIENPMIMAIEPARIQNLEEVRANRDPMVPSGITLKLGAGDTEQVSCIQGRQREGGFLEYVRVNEERGTPVSVDECWWWFLVMNKEMLDRQEYHLVKLHLASNRGLVTVPTTATEAWEHSWNIFMASGKTVEVDALLELGINADQQRLFVDEEVRDAVTTLVMHKAHLANWNWATLRKAVCGDFGIYFKACLANYAQLLNEIDEACGGDIGWCTPEVLARGLASCEGEESWLELLDSGEVLEVPGGMRGVLVVNDDKTVFFGPVLKQELTRVTPYREVISLISSWFDPMYYKRGPGTGGNVGHTTGNLADILDRMGLGCPSMYLEDLLKIISREGSLRELHHHLRRACGELAIHHRGTTQKAAAWAKERADYLKGQQKPQKKLVEMMSDKKGDSEEDRASRRRGWMRANAALVSKLVAIENAAKHSPLGVYAREAGGDCENGNRARHWKAFVGEALCCLRFEVRLTERLMARSKAWRNVWRCVKLHRDATRVDVTLWAEDYWMRV
ncbi:hypothetical protein BOTBODRAFT_178748 [Botryobasidium botryosum FD-172 SS1]|uniref:Uncharacterized protein n=1 Tax=Botryobasidium botryosum (strain FD-172 SS1) TaxID=930990 RepID=A0A067M274_BOTB1|nr:hypothetical protein BOTBODRAFT_178748 [Botryobasidium botryosum FD-172 SS1]